MFTVTASARDILKNSLKKTVDDEEILVRIGPSSKPQELGFFLDTEKEGDVVIDDNEGNRLLLVEEGLATLLNRLVLDYGETDQGMRLTITQVSGFGV